MKSRISAVLCALLLLTAAAPAAQAADLAAQTLTKGILGTLNASGASYEARMTLPGYLGQLEIDTTVDGEEESLSVSVVRIAKGESASVSVALSRFDGCIYQAGLTPDQLIYKQGVGFARQEAKRASGSSDKTGGSLDLGKLSGLYTGRIYFYYSMEDLGYKNIDVIPDEKWTELFWFNLGVDYVLVLTEADAAEFLETGELGGYTWPGLRRLLTGESDLEIYTSGSFDNFRTVNTYENGVFSDVSTQWYAPYAGRAYEVNLMKGNADGTFYPQGQVTVAEAVTMAARLHNIYYGRSGDFLQESPWYSVYAGYAVERGMIDSDTFDADDYERPVTRREMALLLSRAVDLTELPRTITVESIPDLKKNDTDYAAVLALYESGVLTGSDDEGSFLPDQPLTRAEACTMIARLVTPELRAAPQTQD